MARELAVFGEVSQEVRNMILDEELTHAVEVLAAQEKAYAVVPRIFYKHGEDLLDVHNQSLITVLDGGIESSQIELDDNVPGADWELSRRQAERRNLERIINMAPGTMCVEISLPPIDKPEDEQLAQHYNGLTMLRASIKDQAQPDKITQYGFVLPVSNPDFLLALQQHLGVEPVDRIDSLKTLQEPIIRPIDQPAESAAKEIDNLIGAALLETSVGYSAVRMIKRAIESRREAWDFVSSDAHHDLHLELLANMEFAAKLDPDERAHAMNAIRSGFWKEYKDRFNNRWHSRLAGKIIAEAASRAVADGDVFIACGSTVNATNFNTKEAASSRAQVAESLRREVRGSGACQACGANGTLYGCGVFCGRCNDKWCDEYSRSGKQLNAKELAYLSHSRPSELPKKGIEQLSRTETLGQYWQRIGRELRLKREAKN
jgi:hypothetical protein